MRFFRRIYGIVYQTLYPGIRLKRWFFLLLFSVILLAVGMSGVLGDSLKGRKFHIQSLRTMERNIQDYYKRLRGVDRWIIVLGGIGIFFAVRRGYFAILAVFLPRRERQFMRMAYERARRKRGPRIVAIGGGTGLPSLLVGLKEYTDNLTAIVTVADDGGSSGRLRRQLRILPPGDLRNCLVALAEAEPLMGKLFQHRFSQKGELHGHSFGNLFLAALADVSGGDFSRALAESSKVLAVRGRVLPVTLDLVMLAAKLKNGKLVRGESRIRRSDSPIERLHLVPRRVKANPEAVRAIGRADIIVLGPGSLYTSVVPNLLVPQIREAVGSSRGLRVYVCNIMTEPGETDGFSTADHLAIIGRYAGEGSIDAVVINLETPSPRLLVRYARERAFPVANDAERIRALGVRAIEAKVLDPRTDYVRHDGAKLARAVMKYAVI